MAEKAVIDMLNVSFTIGAVAKPAGEAITPDIAALLDHASSHKELIGDLFARQSRRTNAGNGRNA